MKVSRLWRNDIVFYFCFGMCRVVKVTVVQICKQKEENRRKSIVIQFSILSRNMSRRGNRKDVDVTDEDNPVLAQFKLIAQELDERNDRHERIVKISRDITIESKRIIFLLHTIDERKNNKERVLGGEAKDRLAKLCETKFQQIAREMIGMDEQSYIRGFTAGLQEFIEAFTFYELCAQMPISSWKTIVEKHLMYEDEEKKTAFQCPLPPMEYMLGLQDTTGELMRKSVNSLGAGDVDQCTEVCNLLRRLYENYIAVGPVFNREWSRKMFTLRQSLLKSEYVCYSIRVRGKEAAKWSATQAQSMVAAVPQGGKYSDDEGIA